MTDAQRVNQLVELEIERIRRSAWYQAWRRDVAQARAQADRNGTGGARGWADRKSVV